MPKEQTERAPREDRENQPKKPVRPVVKRILIAAAVLAAALALIAFLGRIETVEIKLMNGSNETHFYTDDEIAEACGVAPGSPSVVRMVMRTKPANVVRRLPLITDVSTHVGLRKATIYVKFSPRVYVTEAGEEGAALVLSDELRVVPGQAPAGATALLGVYFKAGEAGEKAECTDPRMLERLEQLSAALDELPSADGKVRLQLAEIDMTNRLRVTVTHEGRVRVVLGKAENLKEKLIAARELIDQREKKDPGSSYIIYATGSNWYYMSEVYSVSGDFVPAVEGDIIDGVVEGMDSLDDYDEAYGEEDWYDGGDEDEEEEEYDWEEDEEEAREEDEEVWEDADDGEADYDYDEDA